MKVGELIRLLGEDGWRLARTRVSHRQYRNFEPRRVSRRLGYVSTASSAEAVWRL
jgi:hypothetical protein